MFQLFILKLLCVASGFQKPADFSVNKGSITQLQGPKEIALGKTATIRVQFDGGVDGCAKAHRLGVSVKKRTLFISAFYSYPKSKSVICTEAIPTHTLSYTFTPKRKGKYIFKTETGLSDTLTVF